MTNLVQQQQPQGRVLTATQPFLTTSDLQAQVVSYQAVDYDDAIKRCSDWQNLNRAAKQHFLYQALIKGSEEGVSRKQVFLDLPEGFIGNGTFYRWIQQAQEEQQKLFPPAQERPEGYKKKESEIGHSGKESQMGHSGAEKEETPHHPNCACPVCLEQRRVERTTPTTTPEMPVPTSLDQTTFPDGSVVNNLEAAYEAPAALPGSLTPEEDERPPVDAPGALQERSYSKAPLTTAALVDRHTVRMLAQALTVKLEQAPELTSAVPIPARQELEVQLTNTLNAIEGMLAQLQGLK